MKPTDLARNSPGFGTLIVLRGLPGSGKTRWARAYVDAHPAGEVVRLSRDDLRAMAVPTGYRVPTPEVEPVITCLELAAAAAVLTAGVDVVVDAMNLRDAYLRSWAELAARVGARLTVRDEFLQVSVAECIRRDARRAHPLGAALIVALSEAPR